MNKNYSSNTLDLVQDYNNRRTSRYSNNANYGIHEARGSQSQLNETNDINRKQRDQCIDILKNLNFALNPVKIYKNEGEITRDRNRLQFVNWLQENKKDIIRTFQNKQDDFIGTVSYLKEITKDEFDMILIQLGISKDKSLFERLYWLFDINGNKQIDSHEVEYGLKIFKENSLEQNIKLFFSIADQSVPGYINESELKNLFQKNLTSMNDIRICKLILSDFYNCLKIRDPQKGITEEEMLMYCLTDHGIRQIINKNTRILKSNKAEEYQTPSQYLVCEQAVKNEGIFFAEDDNIYRTFKEKEQMYLIGKEVKQDMAIIKKLNKESGILDIGENNSDSEDDNSHEKVQ